MPTAARLLLKTAGFEDEQLDELDSLTDEQIDQQITAAQQSINDIEFRKKMRKTARERREERQFETDDIMKLAASDEKIVIDKVPPKFRREYLLNVE